MFKKNRFLFISILVHLVVIYVVAQSVMFPPAPESLSDKPVIIQAKLLFDLAPVIPETIIEEAVIEETEKVEEVVEEQQIIEPQKQPETVEAPVQEKINETPEPELRQTLPPIQPETPPPVIEDIEQNEPEKNDETPDDTVESIIIDKNKTPAPSSEVSAPATSMARRDLKSFQQQQQDRLAERAARRFQQYKNSPEIDNEVKNPFMTEDEKFREETKLRADCSSTTNKVAAVAAGLFGGNVDCTETPEIEGFIQKRLNKTSHLPEQSEEKQRRPKSLVIQEQR